MNKRGILAWVTLCTFFFIGMLTSTPSAFAKQCFDQNAGSWVEVPGDECPDWASDPGLANDLTDDNNLDDTTTAGTITTFTGLLSRIQSILNVLVPFLVGLGVFVIFYGIFRYISQAAEEEKRAEARMFIVWGIVGVFLMVSVWGLLNILVNTFDLKRSAPTTVPSVFPGATN